MSYSGKVSIPSSLTQDNGSLYFQVDSSSSLEKVACLVIPIFLEYCTFIQSNFTFENEHLLTMTFGKILTYLNLLGIFGDRVRSAVLKHKKPQDYGMEDDLGKSAHVKNENFEICVELNYRLHEANQYKWGYSGDFQDISDVLGTFLVGQDNTKWGLVDILCKEDGFAEIVILKIAPKQSIPLHVHQVMKESEIVMDLDIQRIGSCIKDSSDALRTWNNGAPHSYYNPSDNWKLILCIDQPCFMNSDEILISGYEIKTCDEQNESNPFGHFQYLTWQIIFSQNCHFTFPGGISSETQTVRLDIDPKYHFNRPDAVCCCIFIDGSNESSSQILLVYHSKRGWELPGGKVESIESPEQAVYRELLEESGISQEDLKADLALIFQYCISSDNDSSSIHRKSVYAMNLSHTPKFQELSRETLCAKFFNVSELLRGEFPEHSSPLIKDLVFQLALRYKF
jgi:8-oxo-dGTP diphosphatase